MNSRDTLMTTRFRLNMERINGLVKIYIQILTCLSPPGFAQSEGARADILRAIVVFLHSTFEDLLRSRSYPKKKNFTFYSATDIKKILQKCRLNPPPFNPLSPPLTQMAKRRTRIVHYADLS